MKAELSWYSRSGCNKYPARDGFKYRKAGRDAYNVSTELTLLHYEKIFMFQKVILAHPPLFPVEPIFFMKVMTSDVFQLPCESLEMVSSVEPITCLSERDSRSAYCDDTCCPTDRT